MSDPPIDYNAPWDELIAHPNAKHLMQRPANSPTTVLSGYHIEGIEVRVNTQTGRRFLQRLRLVRTENQTVVMETPSLMARRAAENLLNQAVALQYDVDLVKTTAELPPLTGPH